jgi:hypothetical protein
MPNSRPSSQGESQVVKDFKQWLETNDKGQAVAVGAIYALTNLVKRSDASTIMELEILLKDAQEQLQKAITFICILRNAFNYSCQILSF